MRCHFQRCVSEQATEAVFKRAFDDFGQERFNRLTWRQDLLHARDTGSHVGVQIAIKALRKECPFVAEGVVEAGGAQAHGITEIAHRGGSVAGRPKASRRGLKGGAFVELTRSGQSHSTRLA